ncbi:MAG: 3-deoxy-8-phosphooctulonate synthase [Myxococcota bacterium]
MLISGPCVIESKALCLEVGAYAKERAEAHGFAYVFKASFDKANRTSIRSFRGDGVQAGLDVLQQVGQELDVPVTTDIHLPEQAAAAAQVVDLLQIPAFLCRQTDLLLAAAKTGRPVNVKKGQFLAPEDIRHAVTKLREGGCEHPVVTERGTSFGYHNLVVDMRGLVTMREVSQCPVIFDATHSVQRPSAGDGVTGGDRTMAPVLARAAMAVGVDGIFAEVHPRPDEALSDGPNALNFEMLDEMLSALQAIHQALAR